MRQSLVFSNLLLASILLCGPVRAAEPDEQANSTEGLGLTGTVIAAGPSDEHRRGGFEGRHGFGQELGITDAQLERLHALRAQYQDSVASKKAQMHSLFRQQHDLMTQPTIDRQQITSMQDRINAMRTELANARLSYSMDRAEVFTVEQRKIIRHKMLSHMAMGGHGCHHGHHGG
jgi:Spy/CpxP family protein refolding chaperone